MAENTRTKHGMAKRHPLYGRWVGMRQRCNDVKHEAYERYGGAGIKVCERWDDFANFVADMGLPEPGMSLERRDGSKGYEPGNCYWATAGQQVRNRRMTVWIEFRGETLCLSDWASRMGVSFNSMKERIQKWGVEKALTTPRLINGQWQKEKTE